MPTGKQEEYILMLHWANIINTKWSGFITTQEICLLETKLLWAFRKEANMMKLTISEIHLDRIQDYIFIWATADYCPQRGVLKLDYPLVGDESDPMDVACQPHTPLHLCVFSTCLERWDGIQNDTKTSHPQITMASDPHMWIKKWSLNHYICIWEEGTTCDPPKNSLIYIRGSSV